MNRVLMGFAVALIGAAAVGSGMMKKQPLTDSHRRTRQVILYYTLSRVEDPIIVLGDSIVEASTLPRELCGHPIVNAGLDGASTTSDLGNWLTEVIGGKPIAAVVVALGVNDALGDSRDVQKFRENYLGLLTQLSKTKAPLVVLAVASLDEIPRLTREEQATANRLIDSYNSTLPELAAQSGAAFVALPPMPNPHTIDGVHLSAAGYQLWNQSVLQGASVVCDAK
jgi:hypothetical protein